MIMTAKYLLPVCECTTHKPQPSELLILQRTIDKSSTCKLGRFQIVLGSVFYSKANGDHHFCDCVTGFLR